MTEKQLKFLLDFKRKKKHAPSKQDHDEVDDIISDLKSLNIISERRNSNTLEIVDGISFDKLIELKSLSNFKKWYSDKDKIVVDNSLNIHGNNYGIQSSDSTFNKPKIKQTIEAPINKPAKKKLLKKIYSDPWFIGIGLIIIEEIFVGYLRGLLNF